MKAYDDAPPITLMTAASTALRAWVVLQCLCLSACAPALQSDLATVSGDIADRMHMSDAPDLESGPFTVPPGVVLDDGLSSDEAVTTALWNNARFRADLAQLGIARADLAIAGQLPNPVLSLLFPVGPKQLEFTVSQALSFLWQRPYRVEAARLDAERVAENLVQHGLDLVLTTRTTHADFVAARARFELQHEHADVLDSLSSMYGARVTAGEISEFEASTVRIDAMRSRAAALQARHMADTTRNHLTALMGLGIDTLGAEPVRGPNDVSLRPITTDSLIQIALAARPDIRAAELVVEAAGARIGLERAQIFQLIASLDANVPANGAIEAGPGIQVELPILSQNQGGRMRAKAEMEEAVRLYLAREHAVIREVRDAGAAVRDAAEENAYWNDQIIPDLERARRQMQRAFEAGDRASIAVLEAERRLLEARLQGVASEAALERARARLDRSVGIRLDG